MECIGLFIDVEDRLLCSQKISFMDVKTQAHPFERENRYINLFIDIDIYRNLTQQLCSEVCCAGVH